MADNTHEVSSPQGARARREGNRLVIFALEPRAYSQAIGLTVAAMRPGLDALVVDPEDLPEEMGRRSPALVLSGLPRPDGCGAAVRWVRYRPFEDPDVVRVDGVPHRFPGLDLEDLLGLVDRFCGNEAQAAG